MITNCKCSLPFRLSLQLLTQFTYRDTFELKEDLIDNDIPRWRYATKDSENNNVISVTDDVNSALDATSEPSIADSGTEGSEQALISDA